MLIDAFTYFNEETMLRIRLEELGPVVDFFVLVEAMQSFTGQPKPLYSNDIGSWIDPWRDRILRVEVDFPKDMTPWDREAYQRNKIMDGLYGVVPEAFILISDVDEIPRASSLIQVHEPVQLDVTQYFWKFNWQVPQHCNQGARPVLVRKADLKEPQALRSAQLPRIPRAGWHFSFFGDGDFTRRKIKSFSHTEMNQPEYKSEIHIQRCIREGVDPFNRFPLKYVDIDNTFPLWVREHQEDLNDLIVRDPFRNGTM